jgi:hypothetical protein
MRPLRRWCAGCAPDLVRRLRELEEEDRQLAAQLRALRAQIQRALEALEADRRGQAPVQLNGVAARARTASARLREHVEGVGADPHDREVPHRQPRGLLG